MGLIISPETAAAGTLTGTTLASNVVTSSLTAFGNTPTLVTPILGVATATSINKVTLTAPATGSTLTIADGKTLTVSNSITLAGTDATVMTFPTTTATIARIDAANTFTGTQTFSNTMILASGQSTSTAANSNLWINGGTGLGSSVATAAYITNSNNIQFRVGFRGSASTVATAANDVFALAIGDNTFTEATSGTSALAGGLYIKTQTFTDGSGATTNFQNLYVGDAPASTAVNNWSLNAGASKFRGMLTLAAGTATAGTAPLKFISGTSLTTPEAGTMEFDGTDFFLTPAAARQKIAYRDLAQTFTGTQTFGIIVSTGGLQSAATGTNANIFIGGGASVGSGTVSTAAYITGANNIQFRVGFRGSTSTVATAGNDIFALAIGDNNYTEATSGTSALGGGLYIKTQTFVDGAGATTDFQNAYFGDAPTGGVNNWSLNAGASQFRGNITLSPAGSKINITTGTNASVGVSTLVGGTVTVNTTAVTANSKIFLTDATTGVLTNIGTPTVGTIVAGTSFVINSSNVLDTSSVNWLIIN